MGFIVSQSIKANDKIEFRVIVNYAEALLLNGRATNIHIFSEDVPVQQARMVSRGKRGETKYFLVPKMINKNLNSKSEVRCQRMDTDSSTVFFYTIKK